MPICGAQAWGGVCDPCDSMGSERFKVLSRVELRRSAIGVSQLPCLIMSNDEKKSKALNEAAVH